MCDTCGKQRVAVGDASHGEHFPPQDKFHAERPPDESEFVEMIQNLHA